jgi:hypothetical protein
VWGNESVVYAAASNPIDLTTTDRRHHGHLRPVRTVKPCASLFGSVSSGQELSHYRSEGEPPTLRGCARVSRPNRPQPSVKGVWGETQVDDQGGSILAAIMAQFLTAIITGDRLEQLRKCGLESSERANVAASNHVEVNQVGEGRLIASRPVAATDDIREPTFASRLTRIGAASASPSPSTKSTSRLMRPQPRAGSGQGQPSAVPQAATNSRGRLPPARAKGSRFWFPSRPTRPRESVPR